jgi:small subunit ribosomal protein S7
MSRRRRAEKRERKPDTKYGSVLVNRLVNTIMERGQKSVAEQVVHHALDEIADQSKKDGLEVLQQAMDNVKPHLEVKSRRVGGATYQVPVEVNPDRQLSLAMRWLIDFAKARKGVPMRRALAMEVLDAYKNQGNAIKKREDTHKMAQANRAFAHYRW